jgi:uncharacterized protein with von Willebrand factor type A (vWA) domain
MTESARPCQATTKLGAPCKNKAQPGSKFCSVHRRLSAGPEEAQVQAAIAGVNQVAEELRQATPTYQPPSYSPQALLALLQQNAEHLADKAPILGELRRNLEGTKPEDLVDPETWKGLWYILNYTAQAQSRQALDAVVERLAQLPGGDTLLLVKSTIESASPKDLLDLNTWKGALIIVNAAVQAQANEVKRRVLGREED